MTVAALTFPETCVAIDLETTGLRPDGDEIIEVGAVLFRGAETLDTFHQMVDPGRSIPSFVSLLTGITADDLSGAPRFDAVLEPLRTFLADHAIVGQNVSFDLAFLAAKGLRPPGPVYDTRDLSRLLRPDATDHGLAALAAFFAVVNESPHRALADAETTMRVFQAFWERLCGLRPETLAMARSLAIRAGEGWPLGRLVEEAARQREAAPGTPADVVRALLHRLGPPEPARSPLRPRLVRERLQPEALEALFGPEGRVAQTLEGYEPRPQQGTMAARIAQALDGGETLLIEAPPGTGKSLAYLVPALAFARANHAPVVVATSTKGLQEQLAAKDLPGAFQVLGIDPAEAPVAVLKGRGNYLCLSRLVAALERTDLTPEDVSFLVRLLVWLESTERGDIGELALMEQEEARWDALSASAGEDHASCAFQREGNCFLARSRRLAQGAFLIITNHALLLADSAREGGVLGHVKHLVLDEAHHLEREATEQYGRRATQREVDELLAALGAGVGRPRFLAAAMAQAAAGGASGRVLEMQRHGETLGARAEAAHQRARSLFSLLGGLLARQRVETPDGDTRLRLTSAYRQRREWQPVETAWEELGAALGEVDRSLGPLRDAVGGVTAGETVRAVDDLLQRVRDLRSRLEITVAEPGAGGITWITGSPEERQGISLHWAPLTTAPLLRSDLFHDRESVILTGATLTTAGGFGYIRSRLGLDDADELLLDSPFDLRTAAAVFAPADMPGPDASGYARAVEQAVAQVASIAGGGVLVLFTSHSALRQAYTHLRAALQPQGVIVLAQGIDGPPARLAEIMRRQPKTVVLGAATFWEGIDLAGDALRVLVIARLPFAVPSDPIIAARSETYADPFSEFTLPETLLRFRQGLGRLIRSGRDQGAIVLLDSRILTRSYGAAFLDALPSGSFSTPSLAELPQEVGDWLHESEA